jgi:hypothetical protein
MVARARLLRTALLASLLGSILVPGVPSLVGAGVPSALAAPQGDASSTLVVLDAPRGGNSGTQLYVAGWAADPNSPTGTGVDRVDVYLDGDQSSGTLLGRATYGLSRPDVAAHLGSRRFALSGFALLASASPGPHTVYVYAHPSDQPGDQGWTAPKTAAVMVGGALAGAGGPPGVLAGAGGPPGALAGIGGPPGALVAAGPPPLSGVTERLAGVSGSYTLGAIPPVGANYPPGPADTGGPIYAPVSFGWGLYGPPLPFPDYPLYYTPTGYAVPSSFDFSLGAGNAFYSADYLFNTYGAGPGGFYGGPWRSRWGLNSGPLYCPVYTYSFC